MTDPAESGLDPEILNQLRVILRRDLKLGDGDPLPVDGRLFGGENDLDSLDMLLLITSIERQFKVRIADKAQGEQAFQTVGSLAKFVQQRRDSSAGAVQSASPNSQIDWLARLPHGKEFRFISRITEVRPGDMATGVWKLDGSESFFESHFPGAPIVPGVLIAEALAQLSGFAGPDTGAHQGKIAQIDVRFEQPVVPPAEIQLESKFISSIGPLQRCDVIAKVKGAVVARGSITLARGGGDSK
jgi:3-hydroxyacyl-[acyl-carrier-protein] dehydratase